MEKNVLVLTSGIGIGVIVIIALFVIWAIGTFLKRKMALDQSNQNFMSAQNISWEEKREHPRVAVTWEAVMETLNGPTKIVMKDVSIGGAFVVCDEPLPLKQQFRVTVQVPDEEPFSLNGEVVWSNINVPEDKIICRGMGMKFAGLSSEEQARLKNAIEASSSSGEDKEKN